MLKCIPGLMCLHSFSQPATVMRKMILLGPSVPLLLKYSSKTLTLSLNLLGALLYGEALSEKLQEVF